MIAEHLQRALLVAAVCLSMPTSARPQEAEVGPFDVVEVAPGVLAAVLRPDVPSYAFANSLVVVGDQGVLLVDTQQDPAAARSLLAEVQARTGLPVRWVVNTHAHGDHVWGNQVYRAAFPDVSIVAHRATRAYLEEHGSEDLAKQRTAVAEGIGLRRQWLARGTGPDGTALTDDDRESLRRSLAIRTAYLEELDTVRLVLPDTTFDDAMTLDLGGRTVELYHVGPAHTPGDVVVYLPGSGVLAAGDVVEEGRLWLEGADVRGWARALSRLRQLPVSAVLPGHGGLSRGGTLLEVQGGFLEAVVAWADVAREGCAPGAPIPERVMAFAQSFEGWGVESNAFGDLAREACRAALPDAEGDADPTS